VVLQNKQETLPTEELLATGGLKMVSHTSRSCCYDK